jgi:hypothetical protein
MPVQLSVTTNNSATLVRKGLEDLAAETPKIGRETIYTQLKDARTEMSKPAKPITYPVNWDSQKQRIKFFASDGFGKGIPYTPTGKSSRSWVIERRDNGWTFKNTYGPAKYLFGSATGEKQSNIHKGRRPVFREVMDKYIAKLPAAITDNLRKFIAKRGL